MSRVSAIPMPTRYVSRLTSSPDTFNYNVLDVSADGKTLTVTSYGINSTVQNAFVEYDPVNNPERALFSFQIRRGGD